MCISVCTEPHYFFHALWIWKPLFLESQTWTPWSLVSFSKDETVVVDLPQDADGCLKPQIMLHLMYAYSHCDEIPKRINLQKGKFWLTVPEVSVHGSWAPLFLGLWWNRTSWWGATWLSKNANVRVARKQKEKNWERGRKRGRGKEREKKIDFYSEVLPIS